MPIVNEIVQNVVLSSLSDHIVVINKDGWILSVNKSWNDYAINSGLKNLEKISAGSNYFSVCEKAIEQGNRTAELALNGLKAVFKKEVVVFELEYPCFGPFDKRWFLLRAMNLENDDSIVVIAHQDITVRKVAENHVETSEIKYRRLFEAAKDGILILNEDSGKISDVNPFLLNTLDYLKEELIGKELWEIGLFSDVNESIKAFQELQKNNYIRYDDLPLKKRNGEILNVEFISNVYDVNNEKVIQCNIRDITNKKKIEFQTLELVKQLQIKNKDLRQFAYMVSHNLRSPIAKIQGLIYLIIHEDGQKDEVHPFLKIIDEEVLRLDEVIQDLNIILTLQESENKGKEMVDLEAMVNQIRQVLSVEIEEAQGIIDTDFIKVPCLVTIKSYCYSILYNLISNAIKYRSMDRRLYILISSSYDAAFTCLSIKDNGIGIDLVKNAEKVFSLYKRFHGNSIPGKGIGLNLVKVQAESLGGTVELKSEVDIGSEFKIYLPLIMSPQNE